MKYQTRENLKAIAAVLGILLLAAVLFWGCWTQIKEQEACNARGGVYVRQAFGYTCAVNIVPEAR